MDALRVKRFLTNGDTGAFATFAGEVQRVLGDWDAERFDYLVNKAGTSHHAAITDVTGRISMHSTACASMVCSS